MPTFTPEDAALANIIVMGKILEALNKSGALSDQQAAQAIKSAVAQLNETGNPNAAAVLSHYFVNWIR